MTTMPYVNIFTKDIKKLSKFYMDVFGFKEDLSLRSPIFRGIRTSKSFFGFKHGGSVKMRNGGNVPGMYKTGGMYDGMDSPKPKGISHKSFKK